MEKVGPGLLLAISFSGLAASLAAPAMSEPGLLDSGRSTSNEASGRRLQDIALEPGLTRNRIAALWGEPTAMGPTGSIDAYQLNDGRWLWLSFSEEEPHGLTRALILNPYMTDSQRLLNALTPTRERRLIQLTLSTELSATEVEETWGPPDALIGSGVDLWIYTMEDGQEVAISFVGGDAFTWRVFPARRQQ